MATRQRDDLRFQPSFFLANRAIRVLVICRSNFENFPKFYLQQLGSHTTGLGSLIRTVTRTATRTATLTVVRPRTGSVGVTVISAVIKLTRTRTIGLNLTTARTRNSIVGLAMTRAMIHLATTSAMARTVTLAVPRIMNNLTMTTRTVTTTVTLRRRGLVMNASRSWGWHLSV